MKTVCWLGALALTLPLMAFGEKGDVDAGLPGAAFDQQRYELGYRVYLASHNLGAAYQVARKATQSRPDDPEWLRRFAQAAEWVGQPAQALAAWEKLARLNDDPAAWKSVGRLAPGLLDDNALLAYQQKVLDQQGVNEAQVKTIAATYERLGQADAGIGYIEGLRGRHPEAGYLLETESTLAEHAGHDDQAAELLEQLIHSQGPRETWLLRLVAIDYTRGRPEDALDELKAAAPQMPADATGFWQSLATISAQLGHDEQARQAYQTLVKSGHAAAADLMAYAGLLQNQDPLAAAQLSAFTFEKFGDSNALLTALYLYEKENRTKEPDGLLAHIKPEQLKKLERDPDFLEHRAQLEWREHKLTPARKDLTLALQLAPDNAELLQYLVLLEIDQHDRDSLRSLLQAQAYRAHHTPSLWPLWAGGWNLLGQPHEALPYLVAYCRANPGDTLAQLHLADTYERWGDTGAAASLRRRVLQKVRQEGQGSMAAKGEELQEALLALRLEQAPPDPGLLLLRQHLHRDAQGRVDPEARELALSWLLRHGNAEKAEAWANKAYPEGAPSWAKAELAQASGDTTAIQQALGDRSRQLTPAEEEGLTGTLAEQMHWPQLEASALFASLERGDASEENAERFRELASSQAAWTEATVDALRQGGLERTQSGVLGLLPLGSGWRLELGGGGIHQRADRSGQLVAPPSGGREWLGLRRSSGESEWALEAIGSQLLRDYVGASLRETWHVKDGPQLKFSADYQADAPESAALLAAGSKNQVAAGGEWPFSHWFLAGEAKAVSFHGQDGEHLGNGGEFNLEAGQHFDVGGFRQGWKLVATDARFLPSPRPLGTALLPLVPTGVVASTHFFMPQGYRQAALYYDFGEADEGQYETRWHGFGELGPLYANTTGTGYEITLGLAGPLFRHDRASLSLEDEKGGLANGGILRRLQAGYRYFY